jgi:hypothetical protein
MSTFSEYVTKLAEADAASRVASDDSKQARNERSHVAVDVIKAAFSEGLTPEDVRWSLTQGGVLKGTISKITTVLTALQNGIITVSEVKSLNGAYTAAKAASVAAHVAATLSTAPPVPFASAPAATKATTPQEAFDLIIDAIKSVTDPDEAFKLGGEWITIITNGITEALASRDDEGEEEEGE